MNVHMPFHLPEKISMMGGWVINYTLCFRHAIVSYKVWYDSALSCVPLKLCSDLKSSFHHHSSPGPPISPGHLTICPLSSSKLKHWYVTSVTNVMFPCRVTPLESMFGDVSWLAVRWGMHMPFATMGSDVRHEDCVWSEGWPRTIKASRSQH